MIELKTWRFIDTKIGSASWNMAVDEALLNSVQEGDLPILRLYGWEPSLTAGRFSDISTCVDTQLLEEEKVPCVRRMSGGGILVHGGDISYSLILPRNYLKDKGVKESYRYVCEFLICLYKKLGHTARFAYEQQLEGGGSDICLAGNEAYDIVIGGKKMGGNAQRHTRHVLFQHGSIPMTLDESYFKPLFLGESGLEHAATLERLGITITYEELSSLVQEAFCETFEVKTVADRLRLSEEEGAKELLAHKYTQERWNIHAKHNHP